MKTRLIALMFALLLSSFANGQRQQESKEEEEDGNLFDFLREREEDVVAFNKKNGVYNANRTALSRNALKETEGSSQRTNSYTSLNGSWLQVAQSAYPQGVGRVECIGFHPTNANIFYVGTAGGGLWKTTNGGASYTPLTDNLPCGGIASVVVHPTIPNQLYILTGAGLSFQSNNSIGVFVSYDAGATWQTTGLTDSVTGNKIPLTGYKLAMHPNLPEFLYACTNQGMYRSTDAGQTWTLTLTGNAGGRNFPDICDVEFKPGNPNVVYASGFGDRFFVSSSLGSLASFTTTKTVTNAGGYPVANNGSQMVMLAVTPAAPNSVYVVSAIRPPNLFDDPAIFFTRFDPVAGQLQPASVPKDVSCSCTNGPNAIDQFTARGSCSGIGRWYGQILVDDDNAMNIMIGGVYTHASSDGGLTWRLKDQRCSSPYGRYYHPDIANMYEYNNTVFVCTDGGVNKQAEDYATNTSSWTDVTANIINTQPYSIDGSPQDAGYYLYGLQDNGVRLLTTPSTTVGILGADGTCAKIDQTDKNIFYASIQNGDQLNRIKNGVYKALTLVDPSCSCPDADEQSGSGDFSKCFAVDENDPKWLYAVKREFYYSSDTGNTWVRRYTGELTTPHKIMRVAKSNRNVVYIVGEDNVLRRSVNLGSSWIVCSLPFNDLILSDVAISKSQPLTVYITCLGNVGNKKLFKSTDGGATAAGWENLSAGLPNVDILTIEIDPATADVYAGTGIGVYLHPFNENRWINFSNGLPVTQVRDLYINPIYQTVSAGTFGRSIWKSDLYGSGACFAFRNLTSIVAEHYVVSARDSILTTSVIESTAEANVKFTAQNGYVRLAPGFVAKAASTFKAAIEPCGAEPELFKSQLPSPENKLQRRALPKSPKKKPYRFKQPKHPTKKA